MSSLTNSCHMFPQTLEIKPKKIIFLNFYDKGVFLEVDKCVNMIRINLGKLFKFVKLIVQGSRRKNENILIPNTLNVFNFQSIDKIYNDLIVSYLTWSWSYKINKIVFLQFNTNFIPNINSIPN